MDHFFTWWNSLGVPESLAAALQAFAGLVAIVISVVAIFREGWAARRQEKLEGGAIAVAILAELQIFPMQLENERHALLRLKELSGLTAGQAVAASIAETQLTIPPMVDRYTDKLYLLGPAAGPKCLQLVSLIRQYNAMAASISQKTATLNAQQWPPGIDVLLQTLDLLNQTAQTCEAEVRPLYEKTARRALGFWGGLLGSLPKQPPAAT